MSHRLPLLLLADTSVPEALGSKFLRGAAAAGLDNQTDLQVAYSSPAPTFSPSMSNWPGRVFYRLADRRSWEWWGFQRRLITTIRNEHPQLVLVTGILPLQARVFEAIHQCGGRIVNYLTDDPWNPIHRRRCFLHNLAQYDHIFSTKQALRQRLQGAGTPSTSWLPFAYDPVLHQPPNQPLKPSVDVVFVGTGARERLPWLQALADLPGLNRRIHGNSWTGLATPGWQRCNAITGDDYNQAISSARVVLGLLRQANGDLSTDRSYEIGAIGGCGLYQDSPEHRALLPGYPEAGFFSNPQELRQRVNTILNDPALQLELRQRGTLAVRQPRHTYAARLRAILSWAQVHP
jgi:hypothetical protein